ncbi:hypothetical protein [Prescottella equi]|uniref:hypothetical protein n=1 Tax=Rhodococcus hoagii TaxID=43767 RepID=UPI001E47B0E4|nr:hypothetical protein [Prescottella equi]
MAIQGTWICVDIIGSRHGGDVFIHSGAGARVARPLARCAKGFGLDKKGEAVVRAVIEAALAGREIPKIDGLYVETHQIDTSDGTPVGLVVWVGVQPPTPRPVYNGWVLDMQAMTTRTSGDNVDLYGTSVRPTKSGTSCICSPTSIPRTCGAWSAATTTL